MLKTNIDAIDEVAPKVAKAGILLLLAGKALTHIDADGIPGLAADMSGIWGCVCGGSLVGIGALALYDRVNLARELAILPQDQAEIIK